MNAKLLSKDSQLNNVSKKQVGPYIIGTVNIKPRKCRITLKYVLRRHRKIQAYCEKDIQIVDDTKKK